MVDSQTGNALQMNLLSPEDYEALAELRYLGRKFLRFSKDFLRAKPGLNPEQYEALLAIKAFPGKSLTISQLSERLQVKHHSAVNIVDRLVDRKLIRRRPGEHDRRERHLELTAKGEQLIDELAAAHYAELRTRSGEMIKALERLRR
jgi:DNA-binding MarR family transcriptional regulator